MRRIFVDRSFWYALVTKADLNHQRSALFMRQVQKEGVLLITSELVIAETQRLLMYRFGPEAGHSYLRQILIQVDRGFLGAMNVATLDLQHALALMDRFADQDLSLTDACSAVLMHRERIEQVASFDRHFHFLGFSMLPG